MKRRFDVYCNFGCFSECVARVNLDVNFPELSYATYRRIMRLCRGGGDPVISDRYGVLDCDISSGTLWVPVYYCGNVYCYVMVSDNF